MWFNDDEYEDDNGQNTSATNSPSGTNPGTSIVSQSASISPTGISQSQTLPGTGSSTASGIGNTSSATGR